MGLPTGLKVVTVLANTLVDSEESSLYLNYTLLALLAPFLLHLGGLDDISLSFSLSVSPFFPLENRYRGRLTNYKHFPAFPGTDKLYEKI